LKLDAARSVEQITTTLRHQVFKELRRKGAVVGLSGGIDSSLVTVLSAKALGNDKVLALLMPEKESSNESLELGQLLADHFGIPTYVENITPILEAAGCYARRDEMIQSVIPEYGPGYRCKIVLPDLSQNTYRIFSVVVRSPEGKESRARLTPEAYLGVVAATNFKQRVRKMMEYYHADRINYAVMGTPNRLEYDQGFFVKNGDGSADAKPIAHLYKTQVYQLAAHLGVPPEICRRPPTTDTYSLSQSQEEFYFSLPYDQMDMCLYGRNHGLTAADVAAATGLTREQVEYVYNDIATKRRTTRYLQLRPLLIENVPEVSHTPE
jgi:NAD+ synthase